MITFIINPAAGSGYALKVAGELNAAMAARGTACRFLQTTRPGEATEMARREAADPDCALVVAVGGDGTAFEVACGLMDTGKPMGIIPAGTGNDFIKTVGIPPKPADALEFLLTHAPRPVDMGVLNEGSFLNCCGTGFDVLTLDCTESAKRFCRGILPYLIGLFRAILRNCRVKLTLEVDGVQTEEEVLICSVANGRYLGGGIQISPRSDPADGKLDVVIVQAMPRRRILRYLPALLKGRHLECTEVCRHQRCEHVTMTSPGMRVNVDGEIFSMDRVSFGIRPGALTLVWEKPAEAKTEPDKKEGSPMAEMGKKIKSALIRSMEAISNTAGNVASNTRYKVSELNLLNRREEILNAFGNKAYELYRQGEIFPASLMAELQELAEVDNSLDRLRTEHQTRAAEQPEPADAAPKAELPEDADIPEALDAAFPADEPEAAPVPQMPEAPLPSEAPAAPVPVLQTEPEPVLVKEENE